MRSVALSILLVASVAQAVDICSPFDKDPANASVLLARLPDGGIAPDQPACCDGRTTDDGCGPRKCPAQGPRNVGAPVDTLNGFAWLERTDVDVPQPWGPRVTFARHYSTAWAQGAGSTTEVGPLGPGWSHSWASALVPQGGASPASRVVLRQGDTSSQEYNLSGGAYVSRHATKTLSWDGATQLYTAQGADGSALVFDAQGRLRVLRSADGGEAQLRYAGADASCQVSATLPLGQLCRVDFLFGRQLWFRYDVAGHLAAVAWDSGFTSLITRFGYTGPQLTSATAADSTEETYAYEFNHTHLTAGITVPLLTKATDADGKLVESFGYLQPAQSPSRVSAHSTPDATYSFRWAYYQTVGASAQVVRETTVRGNRENLKLTWADGALTSVCQLDANGNCDITRRREYVRAPGFLEDLCERESSGKFRRTERDAFGRVVAEYSGLTACDTVTDEARAHARYSNWLGDTSRQAWEAWPSVDPSAPAGFRAFTVWDYTVPASAVDPFCGSSACERPEAYNASPLTTRPQRRVEVGRTMLDVDGSWGVQVQVTSYGFDAEGRPNSVDGPRRDVADVRSFAWSPTTPWALERELVAGRTVAQFSNRDVLGNARTVVDENGNTTTRSFDALGQFLGEQLPGLAPSIVARLASGRTDRVTEPSGVITQYGWSTEGQLASTKRLSQLNGSPDAERIYGRVSRRLATLTDRDDGSTIRESSFEYDSQGRRERFDARRGDAHVYRLTHVDEDGRLSWVADEGRLTSALLSRPEDARSHEYLYDDFGNVREVRQVMEGRWAMVAAYTWDGRGNLATFTDSKGVTVRYRHDDFGRLVEVESPDFGLYRTVYDEAGNVAKVRRPDGTVLFYEYDASNRLVAVKSGAATLETHEWGTEPTGVVDCAAGTPLPAAQSKGRLSHVRDASGDWFFGFWPAGQRRFEAHVRPGKTCAKTLITEYDAGGLVTALRYPSGARVEFGYPATGQPFQDRPNSLTLVAGTQRTPLLSNIEWQQGEVTAYTTSGGVTWKLSRWLEGSPSQVTLTRGTSTPNLIRQRKFGRTESGTFTSAFDGWGNPLFIEEATPAWNQQFATNDFPAITGASGPYGSQSFSYLASGDRHEADGQAYCYERGTHRLASVGPTQFRWRDDGSLARREAPDGAALTLCYDERGRVSSTVGEGGDVSRVVTNFRGQRVAEVWSLNGLREDFLVDEASRLLSEEGVGSLTSQYPRPLREYVWLGIHPVAAIDSAEDSSGAVVPRSVTFVHSGHLGEPLGETDEGGRVLRHTAFSPFGERIELGAAAMAVAFETANPYTNHSTIVAVPGARSVKLHLTELALASCDSVVVTDDYGGPVVAEISASSTGDVWTDWLPTDRASIELRAKGCGMARGFKLTEALPEWGGATSETRTDATVRPYPSAGQQFRVALGAGGYLKLTNVNVASCDALEARSTTGQTLWRWKPLASYYQVWTSRLSGDVDVGIWGQGCNATEQKNGFMLSEVRRDAAARAPLALGLPGQKLRADGTLDNWHRWYSAAEARYLQSDPLLIEGLAPDDLRPFVYAENRPVQLVDYFGLLTFDTRAAKACSPEMTKKWIKAYDHVRTMSEDCACWTAFRQQYGVDLRELIKYSNPGPRVAFGDTYFSNSAGEYSDGTGRINLSCARFRGVTTPLAIARTFVHELAHYANDPAVRADGRAAQSNDDRTHGGAYRAEDICAQVLTDKYGFDALIEEAL